MHFGSSLRMTLMPPGLPSFGVVSPPAPAPPMRNTSITPARKRPACTNSSFWTNFTTWYFSTTSWKGLLPCASSGIGVQSSNRMNENFQTASRWRLFGLDGLLASAVPAAGTSPRNTTATKPRSRRRFLRIVLSRRRSPRAERSRGDGAATDYPGAGQRVGTIDMDGRARHRRPAAVPRAGVRAGPRPAHAAPVGPLPALARADRRHRDPGLLDRRRGPPLRPPPAARRAARVGRRPLRGARGRVRLDRRRPHLLRRRRAAVPRGPRVAGDRLVHFVLRRRMGDLATAHRPPPPLRPPRGRAASRARGPADGPPDRARVPRAPRARDRAHEAPRAPALAPLSRPRRLQARQRRARARRRRPAPRTRRPHPLRGRAQGRPLRARR